MAFCPVCMNCLKAALASVSRLLPAVASGGAAEALMAAASSVMDAAEMMT